MISPTSQELGTALRALNWLKDAQSFSDEVTLSSVVKHLKDAQLNAQYVEVGQYLAACQEADEKDMRKPAKKPYVNMEGDPNYEFGVIQRESERMNKED